MGKVIGRCVNDGCGKGGRGDGKLTEKEREGKGRLILREQGGRVEGKKVG